MRGQKTNNDPQSWAVWCHHERALELTSTMALLLQRVRDSFGPVEMDRQVREAYDELDHEEAVKAA